MKTIRRRAAGLLTALMVMASAFAPTVVAANVEIQNGVASITPNIDISSGTVVHFAGYEWYAIGYNGTGVYSENGLTLLLKSGQSPQNAPFGSSPFRAGQNSDPNDGSMSQYSGNNWWYANNPTGEQWADPHEYRGSTLQQKMEEIAGDIETASAREYGMITPRTLTADGETFPLAGGNVENQRLWLLSYDEWNAINDNIVRGYSSNWWLRSPLPLLGSIAVVGRSDGFSISDDFVLNGYAVRPALNINLSSVLFTSSASGTSKKSDVGIADGLVGAAAPGTNLKFTVLDENIPTPAITLTGEGSAMDFDFTGAQTGTDYYLSCVIEQGGEIKYYAKLDANTNGSFSIDTTGMDGAYTLRVFSELVDDEDHTDFASKPYDIPFTVTGGNAEVDVATPNIDTDPTGATYTEGDTSVADLTVAASTTDSGTLTYQWYKNGTDSNTGGDAILGETNATYTPPTYDVGTTWYYAVATNTVAGKTASTPSATAKVEVRELFHAQTPTIDTQPDLTTTCYVDDTDVELAVEASVTDGGDLTYQWYAVDDSSYTNPQAISGAESPTFAPPTDTAGTYYYYVEITNTNTNATGNTVATINSNVATVHVLHYLRLDAIANQTATVGQGYSLTPGYSYSGSDTLEFSLNTALPTGLTLNTGTGEISGTPAEGTEQDYPLTLTVAEQGGGLSASQPFTLTVQAAPPQPPAPALTLATPEDATIAVGSSYQTQLNATYTNGTDTLVYSATGLPAGISIDETTGLISGKPTTEGKHEVTVKVAEENGSLQAAAQFTITVVPAPKDPEPEKPAITLGGLPTGNTVRVGDRFTLTPSEDKVNSGEADGEGPLEGGQTGGTGWTYDSAYFTATFNSPATFTALKEGASTITYTAPDGRSVSVTLTVQAAPAAPMESPIAETGDSGMAWLYALLATVTAALAGGLVWCKLRKRKQ